MAGREWCERPLSAEKCRNVATTRISDRTCSRRFANNSTGAIEQVDPEFRAERFRQDRQMEAHARRGGSLCGGGQNKFHIDAYGQLQLCSNNRRQSYDLRRGSFQEGFYKVLPQFPCPARQPEAVLELVSIERAKKSEVA